MHRRRPSPSPGPRWEALQEPSSSGDEEDEDEDDELLSNLSNQTPARVQPVLKRKESGWPLESIPKRPKHSQQSEAGGSRDLAGGSMLAPAPRSSSSRDSFSGVSISSASNSADLQDPPSTAPAISARPSLSSMLPPPFPSRSAAPKKAPASSGATIGSLSISQGSSIWNRNTAATETRKPTSASAFALLSKPPRPLSQADPKKAPERSRVSSKNSDIPSSLSKELFSAASSSTRRVASASSSVKYRPKPKPIPVDEIIEISDDEPSPPVPKMVPRPSSEVIEILDSDEEDTAAPPAPEPGMQNSFLEPSIGQVTGSNVRVNEQNPVASSSRSRISPPMDQNDNKMDVDAELTGAGPSQKSGHCFSHPAFVAKNHSSTSDDQQMPIDSIEAPVVATLSTTHASTPPASNRDGVKLKSPSSKISSPPRRMSTGSPKSATRKSVGRQGFNPVSVPPPGSPQHPPKPHLQKGVKSASALFRPQKSTLPSSPSSSNSGSSEKSSQPASRANYDDAGIDMRNLNEALGIVASSSRPRTPEPSVSVKAQPLSPEIPEPSTARNPLLDRPKFLARKSSGGRVPAPQIPLHQPGSAYMPIDLTSDKEDDDPDDSAMERARTSAKMIVESVAGSKEKKLESTRPSALSPFMSTLGSRPSSSRASSSTDELALRSAGGVASPPLSASPQPLPSAMPATAASSRPLNDARRNSAPSLGEAPTALAIRSQSPLSRSMTSPRSPHAKQPEARPLSAAPMPQSPTATSSMVKPTITSIPKPSPPLPDLPASAAPLRYTPTSAAPTPSPSPVLATQGDSTASSSLPSSAPAASSHANDDQPAASPTSPVQVSTQPAVAEPPPQPTSSLVPVAVQSANNTLSEDEASEVQQLIGDMDDEMEEMHPEQNDPSMDIDTDDARPTDTSMDISEGGQVCRGLTDVASAPPPFLGDSALPRDPADLSRSAETASEAGSSQGSSTSLLGGVRRSSRKSSHSSSDNNLGNVSDDDFGPSVSVPASRCTTPEDIVLDVAPKKTYGGFAAITWTEYKKDLNNLKPEVYRARDLPHTLQDHINRMTDNQQTTYGARELFEAMINQNTADDEPHAPHIRVENDVDDEATPPWEFHYSNKMWHGDGVPDPDITGLVSCDCRGGCNPKSKTCACLKRQRAAVKDKDLVVEFAYDKTGKLKIAGYPVFECNELCGCSEECRNRVVQHGRKAEVHIRKTERKGWGVFAGDKKILRGTFIGIYAGELLIDTEAHARGVDYNKFGRTYLFDIDFHHLKSHLPEDEQDLWTSQFTVDAYHAGNFTRYLNHSCDPNCRLYPCYINEGNIQKPLLTVFSIRDIEPDEEICFNYQGKYPGEDDDEDEDENKAGPGDGEAKDSVYVPCKCGAKNCSGKMWN